MGSCTRRSIASAMRVQELGVRMEERVALLLPDSPEWVYVFFGAIKAGAVAIPLNTLLASKDYEYLLNDSRARVLVVHASLMDRIAPIRDRLRYLKHLVVVEGKADGAFCFEALMDHSSAILEPVDTSKDDMAFWLYSSGTTGFPKGAIHLHHDMIVAADRYARETIGLAESDVSFSVAKLFFAYGLGNGLYFPLRTGGTTVLLPERPLPEKVFETIDCHRPTVFYSVPTSYAALLQEAEKTGRTSLHDVRMCVSAGETLPRHIFLRWRERFGVEILDGIGSTEILHIFISNRPGRARAGSTGEIVPGFEARIVDDDGAGSARGGSRHAVYQGRQRRSRLLEQTRNDQTDLLRRVDQYLRQIHARPRRLLLVLGPGQRHAQSGRPGGVAVRCGSSAPGSSGRLGERRHGRRHRRRSAQARGLRGPQGWPRTLGGTGAELQEFVKKNTAPHKYPRAVVFVDHLPKTATGKIKRFELRHRAAQDGLLRNKGK